MNILVTGAAGFIGFYVSKVLSEKGHRVVGLDNINDYYDPSLKFSRLSELGIEREAASVFGAEIISSTYLDSGFHFFTLM